MNILEQAKNEKFVKEQFIKGRILDDTKDYGRTQFIDEIYKLQQENKQLKDNWNKLKEYIKQEPTLYFYNDKLPFEVIIAKIINKMQELEQGSDSNE